MDVPGSGLVLEGETLKTGGGYADWNVPPPSGLTMPNECVADGTAFVVNPHSRITTR
ncbi:hypothetical protein [Streptosporangium carneum]|uniref:Uncharacterized protein n=1 Tax=Streptosporangium carneum TaxID=47481 RepID=A0A9W6IA25_9ACTN|nr:hypothetical protein [Streptosporangium carneum]GLK14881.1 hypothetical protein GCM10017600_82940 [Streptosporangium carneum]